VVGAVNTVPKVSLQPEYSGRGGVCTQEGYGGGRVEAQGDLTKKQDTRSEGPPNSNTHLRLETCGDWAVSTVAEFPGGEVYSKHRRQW